MVTDLKRMLEFLKPAMKNDLDEDQLFVVKHDQGPLWVVAGPGSGKTETLVIRTLKLLFVDRINPKAVLITTFTEKAAKNMFDRILSYATYLYRAEPQLEKEIDLHNLRIGTLHSLCNDIMLEFKYDKYENYRLLDQIEQPLFIFEHSRLVKDNAFSDVWEELDYLANNFNSQYGPTKWEKAKGAIALFNRITEDMADLEKMRRAGGVWPQVYEAFIDYENKLDSHGRCDFSHLQSKFLEFMQMEQSRYFLRPSADDPEQYPGLSYVMVDEYQDTNPIQEAIYMHMAAQTHNLCIVGDDDQALYRFRGGTVECMVTFDRACKKWWNLTIDQKKNVRFLNSNYRSHPDIVKYYDEYIKSFDVMRVKGARVEGKPDLIAKSSISGKYPSVAFICGRNTKETAKKFAHLVRELLDNGVISRESDCALLMRSVKETPRYSKYFAEALREVGITPYNPRSKQFLEQEEIMLLMGAFISIVDYSNSAYESIMGKKIHNTVDKWLRAYSQNKNIYPELEDYVSKSVASISRKTPGENLGVNILDIFYRILACKPFIQWQDDPERTYRLGQVSNIFERYAAIPYNKPGTTRGDLRMSTQDDYENEISYKWRIDFYYSLIGLMASEGLNDPEDEEVITPPNRLPIMTVHQAKGLEFPFTFVYGLDDDVRVDRVDTSIGLEEDLLQFRDHQLPKVFKPEERAMQDMVRFFFVAFSRAQHALILLVPGDKMEGGLGFIGRDPIKFRKRAKDLTEGDL